MIIRILLFTVSILMMLGVVCNIFKLKWCSWKKEESVKSNTKEATLNIIKDANIIACRDSIILDTIKTKKVTKVKIIIYLSDPVIDIGYTWIKNDKESYISGGCKKFYKWYFGKLQSENFIWIHSKGETLIKRSNIKYFELTYDTKAEPIG